MESHDYYSGYHLPYGISGTSIIMDNGPVILNTSNMEMVKLVPEDYETNPEQFNFYKESLIYNDLNGKLYSFNGKEHILIYDDYTISSFLLA